MVPGRASCLPVRCAAKAIHRGGDHPRSDGSARRPCCHRVYELPPCVSVSLASSRCQAHQSSRWARGSRVAHESASLRVVLTVLGDRLSFQPSAAVTGALTGLTRLKVRPSDKLGRSTLGEIPALRFRNWMRWCSRPGAPRLSYGSFLPHASRLLGCPRRRTKAKEDQFPRAVCGVEISAICWMPRPPAGEAHRFRFELRVNSLRFLGPILARFGVFAGRGSARRYTTRHRARRPLVPNHASSPRNRARPLSPLVFDSRRLH